MTISGAPSASGRAAPRISRSIRTSTTPYAMRSTSAIRSRRIKRCGPIFWRCRKICCVRPRWKRCPMPAEPVLNVENLSIRFRGQPIDLIDGVSFGIEAGQTLCLVGESGCGKSVTSLAVMGLLPPRAANVRAGVLRFRGQDLLSMSPDALTGLRGNRMAMIFQEPMTSLNPVFTVGDQVAEAVRRHRRCSPKEARERALEMFRKVRMPAAEKRLDDYPHQLSGGMRQRVMIAMALANDPELLI